MSSAAVRRQAQTWLAQGRRAVVVEVLNTRGSVPREEGCRMVVDAIDQLGTIGGGHLEWHAIARARAGLSERLCLSTIERLSLGPSLGQCCGGAVELRYALLDDVEMARWRVDPPPLRVCLHGAGHVGQAIARALGAIECEVDWIDVRESAFPAADDPLWIDSPHIRPRVSDSPAHEARLAQPNQLQLVMTHSHALDFDIVQALLNRPEIPWVGLIGSKTKRAQFEHRLLARGVTAERLNALSCPVGLPGISGKSPAVVAVAVVAQLLLHSSGDTSGGNAPNKGNFRIDGRPVNNGCGGQPTA